MAREIKKVVVGSLVGCKYDVEQTGTVVAVRGSDVDVQVTEGGYVHAGCSEYEEEGDCGCGRSAVVTFKISELF